jgi:hypothetical protein
MRHHVPERGTAVNRVPPPTIKDLFPGPDGEALLSKSAVSRITDRLCEEYEAFSQRVLSDLPRVVDGVYEAMPRLGHVWDGLLVARGYWRTADGS